MFANKANKLIQPVNLVGLLLLSFILQSQSLDISANSMFSVFENEIIATNESANWWIYFIMRFILYGLNSVLDKEKHQELEEIQWIWYKKNQPLTKSASRGLALA